MSEQSRILGRHLRGETPDSIARDFHCSPAAVKRAVRLYLLRLGELVAGGDAPFSLAVGLDPGFGPRRSRAMIRFLEALDAFRRPGDEASIDELCAASDQLMRVIARVRLEVERARHRGE